MKRDLPIALLIFALGLWHNLGYVDTTAFHRDEARWVGRAYFWNELFHPSSETWADGYLTRGQPPLGSYVMGLGLVIQGRDTDTTIRHQLYDFNKSQAWNRLNGRIPIQADIDAGRRTDAFIGALLAMVVFYIGRTLVNRVAGFVAAALLIVHPLHVYLSSLAGSDALLGLLVALSALVAIQLARQPAWWRAVLLGVLLGLGGATKLSPLILAFAVAEVGVILLLNGKPWRTRTDEARHAQDLGWMLLTTPLVAFAAFVASYPYLWSDPIGRTRTLFQFRSDEMTNQGELWEDRAVTGLPDAISHVRLRLGEQLTSSEWLSVRVAERFTWSWDAPWLDLGLGMLGLGLLALVATVNGIRSPQALALVVLVGQVAITLVGMQADFERYHLPMVILTMVGVGALAGYGWMLATVAATRLAPVLTRGRRRFRPSALLTAVPVAPAGASRASSPPAPRLPAVTGGAPISANRFRALVALVTALAVLTGFAIGQGRSGFRAITDRLG